MVKVKNDLTGKTFGRLTVLCQADDYVSPQGTHVAMWLCECSCDNHTIKPILGSSLIKKYKPTRSCGCLAIESGIAANEKRNKVDLSQSYGVLWTTNTNESVYFDLEDADLILNHCWHKDANGYAVTNIKKDNGTRTLIKMHTLLGYYYPDHNDRNKLNNRRENLIPCNRSENMMNRNPQSSNTSGIIGVNFNKKSQKWEARIVIDGVRRSLGLFSDKNDAIRARLLAEKQYYNNFAPQKHLFGEYNIYDNEA